MPELVDYEPAVCCYDCLRYSGNEGLCPGSLDKVGETETLTCFEENY